MRVGCVQTDQRNEIIVINRKPYFKANKPISEQTIKHFGLKMDTMIGYKGNPSYEPAPETVGEKLANFFHKMEINWDTHIDPTKKSKRFE